LSRQVCETPPIFFPPLFLPKFPCVILPRRLLNFPIPIRRTSLLFSQCGLSFSPLSTPPPLFRHLPACHYSLSPLSAISGQTKLTFPLLRHPPHGLLRWECLPSSMFFLTPNFPSVYPSSHRWLFSFFFFQMIGSMFFNPDVCASRI